MGKRPHWIKIHTQFYKHFIGLRRRARNIISRNEAGRLSLKSNINIIVITFWYGILNKLSQFQDKNVLKLWGKKI